MNRREVVGALLLALAPSSVLAAKPSVVTLVGTGYKGYSDRGVNNPSGLATGPDRMLYLWHLANQRIRRLDLKTLVTATVAGNGQRGYSGDGGLATAAALNMPHEIQFDAAGNLYIVERDNHVVRKIDARTGVISTFAGTGIAGFSGDGGPATRAQLRQPHSIAIDPRGKLLICDIGNHRIRQADFSNGMIETYDATGERQATPDGAPVHNAPMNEARTMVFDHEGNLYLALREGNAIYRIASKTGTLHHLPGTGEEGHSGDGGPAPLAKLAGPKGLAYGNGKLFVADTENHAVRSIALGTGIITTTPGTGHKGDGPR